jgi:hypothetical protein
MQQLCLDEWARVAESLSMDALQKSSLTDRFHAYVCYS